MARVTLFLVAVGALAWLAAGWIADRLGGSLSPVARISLAVIVAVLAWTGFSLWAVERMGGGGNRGRGDER